MSAKSLIKSILRRFGYDLVQYVEMPRHPFPVLPFVVADLIARTGQCFIVQVGANDGVRGDPVRGLIDRHGLPALLIEPLPDQFAALQRNYAGVSGVEFVRCAIGPRDGEATLYRFAADAPVPDFAHGLASFDRANLSGVKFGLGDLDRYVVEERVPSLTLTTLLRQHTVAEIGLLQIDVEGFDAKVVRAALEAGLRPPIIHYEHENVHPKEQADCKRALEAAGYRYIDVGRDTLAVHEMIS
jgi:FkbM family methyltransferase